MCVCPPTFEFYEVVFTCISCVAPMIFSVFLFFNASIDTLVRVYNKQVSEDPVVTGSFESICVVSVLKLYESHLIRVIISCFVSFSH